MRLLLLTALTLSISSPAAFAQDWKNWVKQNPTYPSQATQSSPSIPVAPSNSNSPTPTVPSEPLSTHNGTFKTLFMQGCTSRGAQYQNFCSCALREVQNNFTIQELFELQKQMKQTGKLPAAFVTIARPCIAHLQ